MKDVQQALVSIKAKALQLQKMIPAKAATSKFSALALEIVKEAGETEDLIKTVKQKAPNAAPPAPAGPRPSTKRKNRRKVYRALSKVVLDLKAGQPDRAQDYFGRKLSMAKFSAHHEILMALKAGDLEPALDYCSRKMVMIENALKDGSVTMGTSVTAEQFWAQERQRHELSILRWEVMLTALKAGDQRPVKEYVQSKIDDAKCQVLAWGQRLKPDQEEV